MTVFLRWQSLPWLIIGITDDEIHPQPMHNSTLTDSMRVEEIIHGHEEIIQDLISMKSDTFKALSLVLGSRELLRPTCNMNVD